MYTNVVNRADKVFVKTYIGIDHTHVLGNTLQLIATQKAGIFYPGNEAFMFAQSPEINTVFKAQAEERGTTLNMLRVEDYYYNYLDIIDDLPVFQQRNWLLALNVYKYISKRDNLVSLTAKNLLATTKVHAPVRKDKITKKNKNTERDSWRASV